MPLKPWKTLESTYLIRDPWMTLRADKCETSTGIVIEPYYVQEPMDWVHVVAFDDSKNILVIRQYRHAVGQVLPEFPCGAVDPGEEPLAAVTRELLEETGCTFDRIEALPPLSPNPASHSNRVHPFVAFGTRVVAEQNLDDTEEIEFEFLPLKELMTMVRSGEFLQSIHVATLLLALERAGLLQIAVE